MLNQQAKTQFATEHSHNVYVQGRNVITIVAKTGNNPDDVVLTINLIN